MPSASVGIFNIDAEITDGALDLGVAKKRKMGTVYIFPLVTARSWAKNVNCHYFPR